MTLHLGLEVEGGDGLSAHRHDFKGAEGQDGVLSWFGVLGFQGLWFMV